MEIPTDSPIEYFSPFGKEKMSKDNIFWVGAKQAKINGRRLLIAAFIFLVVLGLIYITGFIIFLMIYIYEEISYKEKFVFKNALVKALIWPYVVVVKSLDLSSTYKLQ